MSTFTTMESVGDYDTRSERELIQTMESCLAREASAPDLPPPSKGGGLWFNPVLCLLASDTRLDLDGMVIEAFVINGQWRYRYMSGRLFTMGIYSRDPIGSHVDVTPDAARAWRRLPASASEGLHVMDDYNEIIDRATALLTT